MNEKVLFRYLTNVHILPFEPDLREQASASFDPGRGLRFD